MSSPAIVYDSLAQREIEDWNFILKSQVTAVRSRVQVFGARYRFRIRTRTCTDDPNLMPDGRDLRPESASLCRDAVPTLPSVSLVH